MANISIANTPAAEAAAQEYAERTGNCVQVALADVGSYAYCHCAGCGEQYAADAAAEIWVEGAWLRAAESAGVCHGALLPQGGCSCC